MWFSLEIFKLFNYKKNKHSEFFPLYFSVLLQQFKYVKTGDNQMITKRLHHKMMFSHIWGFSKTIWSFTVLFLLHVAFICPYLGIWTRNWIILWCWRRQGMGRFSQEHWSDILFQLKNFCYTGPTIQWNINVSTWMFRFLSERPTCHPLPLSN